MHINTLYRCVKKDEKFPIIKISKRKLLVNKSDLTKWLDTRKVQNEVSQ